VSHLRRSGQGGWASSLLLWNGKEFFGAVLSSAPPDVETVNPDPARPGGPGGLGPRVHAVKRGTGCVLAVGVATAALVLMLNALESSFIYFPQKAYAARPEDLGLRAETLSLESAGGVRLQGWWIHGGGRTALLFFHGNGGNISHRLERAKLLVESLGLDVVLVDYRGYGASGGTPGESGLYADGEAIARAARDRGFGPERTVLFGESLGCAVAIETALRQPCRAVILETPFLSIAAMAKAIYPFCRGS